MNFNAGEQFRTSNNLPDRDRLLEYSPEGAALLVIRFFGAYGRAFVPGDVLGNISDQAYGRDPEVERVLMEGVAYLERYGLMVEETRTYSSTGRGRQLSREGIALAKSPHLFETFIAHFKDPRSLLHPEITAKALPHFDKGADHFDTAVFTAFKSVEVAVRTAAAMPATDIGVPLMNRAFGANGPLRDPNSEQGEAEGIRNLFAGAIAAYKNPSSHRHVGQQDAKRALNALVLASELLYTVDERRSQLAS
jgi:uncharacterized protein (TIGR02391 family)